MLVKSNKLALFAGLAVAAAVLRALARLGAQAGRASLFTEMKWRPIGPFRGGRTKAITGVGGQPNVFYMAAVNGGVWKTTDFGRTWTPIFDDQPPGSIGAIAVAPSDPNIVYVGSAEGLARPDLSVGDGIYKSTDAGATVDPPQPRRRGRRAARGAQQGPRAVDGAQSGRPIARRDALAGRRKIDAGSRCVVWK